ncbi:MAG TPA: HAD family hydrolase [Burkholderiaceae bacterium]|nr:HAD family hydrolase [Burkholderiaceae bacterium]
MKPLSDRAVFIDKDGTLIEDAPYNVDPALLHFTPGAVEGLRLLNSQGWRLIVVTNQPGVALGRFDAQALVRLQQALTRMLAEEGVTLEGFHACPHAPGDGCTCRKPQPGLLQWAAHVHGIDLSQSWMVGDILNDVEAGRRAGCRTVLLDVGHETEWDLSTPWRIPHHRCRTLLEAAGIVTGRRRAASLEDASHA